MSWVLGIDLGTSFTAAGLVSGPRLEAIALGAHSAAIPSAVYRSNGDVVVGEAALAQGDIHPDRLAVEFKRQFGESAPLLSGRTFVTPEELESALGSWVFKRACELEGSQPSEVVFSFPAFWGAYRRDLFLDIARKIVADPDRVVLVTEPEAAAIYYAKRDRLPPGAVVGVYDLGGGTFDASILRKTDDGFEVLGRPAGDDQLGGVDVDLALLQYVIRQAGLAWETLDRDDPKTVREMMNLRRNVTVAKELLSQGLTTEVAVAVGAVSTSVHLTRRELEQQAEPLIARSLTVFETALAYASITATDLHSILLVGAASRMPRIAEALTERFHVPIALDSHPKFAVCLGAAMSTQTAEQAAALPRPEAALAAGTPLPPPSGSPSPEASTAPGSDGRRRGSRRWIALAAIGAVVVALAVLAALLVFGGSDSARADIPRAASPLPDSTLLFTHCDSNTQLWTIDSAPADGSAPPTEIVNVPSARSWLVALSPDRRSLVYTEERGTARSLVIADTEGKTHLTVATDVAEQARATWAPGGDRVAYVADRNGGQQLVMLDLVKHTSTDLTNDSVAKGDPAWSADGRSIALWRDVDKNVDIYLVNPSAPNGPPQRVTTDPGADADPAWSPDGSQLAFDRKESSGHLVLWVRDVASGAEHRLVDTPADDAVPSYSPDGSAIAFESTRTPDWGPGGAPAGSTARVLWAVGADGKNVRQVIKPTSPAQIDVHAAWSSPSG
jgi:Tol biopolymer transport system component/actin-like ATPase involved in cell morphogenesis